ncbi:hypothetical protein MKC48_20345 [[Clostridium] innocuum]|nr:hypothetical protein [[Clostridium] innocuum]
MQFSTISEDINYRNNDDIFQAYYNTEYVIDALTYDDDLISASERFIRRQQIKITLGYTAHRFCFIFPKHKCKVTRRNFSCNNIFEFMNYCSRHLLKIYTDELVEAILLSIHPIKNIPYTEFSLDYIRTLHGKDLYTYLRSFEYLRINYGLENLYVLLYYIEISLFQDDTTMEFLKQKSMEMLCNARLMPSFLFEKEEHISVPHS